MERRKYTIYLILCMVPVLFCLFLLALVHVLLMLLGVIVILLVLVIIKKQKPELFAKFRKKKKPKANPLEYTIPTKLEREPQVYMVLEGMGTYGARRIMVNKPTYSIGRQADNDYIIKEGNISRHHLRIEYSAEDNVCFAVDTDSQNGTYLNSERMDSGCRYKLMQGDRIMIDDHVFTVEYAHF